MSDKPKSFEEFYYSTEDDVFDIELVTEYVDLHNDSIGKYDRKMFCQNVVWLNCSLCGDTPSSSTIDYC